MYQVSDKIISQKYRGLQTQMLVKTSILEVLSISLEKDATFPEHKSPTHAQLIVLEGALEFHIGQRVYHLKKHQHFSFPKDILHWVKANENSKFLIIR